MIALAKGFLVLGAVAGVVGILMCLVLVAAWITDRWPHWRWLLRRRRSKAVRRAMRESNAAAEAQTTTPHETTLNHSAEYRG